MKKTSIRQPSLFRFSYYLIVNSNNQYWNGRSWAFAKFEAKHYQSWTAVRAAQHQLRHNANFRQFKSHIEAIFNSSNIVFP